MDHRPLTAERWPDFERLFGANGACAGCWCMWWRLPRKQFRAGAGEPNRAAMHALVDAGVVPGILAYDGPDPVGWCAIAPRAELPGLAASRLLAPIDDQPVWSLVCLFVHRTARRRGVAAGLVAAAVAHARDRGAGIIEAYPRIRPARRAQSGTLFVGIPELFERVGFVEVAAPSATRRIMRAVPTAGDAGRR